MSEPILGCCSVCGASKAHHPDCWMGDIGNPFESPNQKSPVYDLAEFELRLEGWVAGAKGCRNDSESALAVEIVLGLLRASKRESK